MHIFSKLLLAAAIIVDGNGNVTGPGFFSGDLGAVMKAVASTIIYLTGAIAVLMVIIGGLRYVLSAGNAKAVEDAKNTILFAVVGLVIAAAAFAIVNFVLRRV